MILRRVIRIKLSSTPATLNFVIKSSLLPLSIRKPFVSTTTSHTISLPRFNPALFNSSFLANRRYFSTSTSKDSKSESDKGDKGDKDGKGGEVKDSEQAMLSVDTETPSDWVAKNRAKVKTQFGSSSIESEAPKTRSTEEKEKEKENEEEEEEEEGEGEREGEGDEMAIRAKIRSEIEKGEMFQEQGFHDHEDPSNSMSYMEAKYYGYVISCALALISLAIAKYIFILKYRSDDGVLDYNAMMSQALEIVAPTTVNLAAIRNKLGAVSVDPSLISVNTNENSCIISFPLIVEKRNVRGGTVYIDLIKRGNIWWIGSVVIDLVNGSHGSLPKFQEYYWDSRQKKFTTEKDIQNVVEEVEEKKKSWWSLF